MPVTDNTSLQRNALAKSIGKAALHALFPKDFEYYLVAFELVNETGTVDYFSFPIMPKSIRESLPELNNIKKTAGGVVALDNETFVPTSISLSGTFGRKFKILIRGAQIELLGFRFSNDSGKFGITKPGAIENVTPSFSSFAKTGYGCIKILESMKEKSRQAGYKLYFYNSILGNNYVVKFEEFTHSQDESSSNMLPQYNISLKSLAPLSAIEGRGGLVDMAKNTGIGVVQKGLNNSFTDVKKSLGF